MHILKGVDSIPTEMHKGQKLLCMDLAHAFETANAIVHIKLKYGIVICIRYFSSSLSIHAFSFQFIGGVVAVTRYIKIEAFKAQLVPPDPSC